MQFIQQYNNAIKLNQQMKAQNYKVLLNELVSVNFKDQYVGPIQKWEAHLNSYISKANSLPHRAFSIFLFNSQNKLLFQRRSADKKTFPLCWTNTCCSHPNMIQLQNKNKSIQNVRQALHRALDRQLKMDLTKQQFYFVDKILYKAEGREQQVFGQYEVDYVYLCKIKSKNIPFTMVADQVCQTEWVQKGQIQEFIEKKQKIQRCHFSPWFMKMKDNGLLNKWWDMVINNNLKNVAPEQQLPVKQL